MKKTNRFGNVMRILLIQKEADNSAFSGRIDPAKSKSHKHGLKTSRIELQLVLNRNKI